MAQLFPFRAYRYNPAKADPAKVLTQPYDKISPEMQARYAAASPYNLITVEKGLTHSDDSGTSNVYTRAAQALNDWIRADVLMQDPAPAVYAYFQEYTVPGTSEHRIRKGLIALGRIVDYADGIVFRHEQTLSGPKADRLELLRHTRAHTGQLFMLYDNPSREVDGILEISTAGPAAMKMQDEYGVVHSIWRIQRGETISEIKAAMADKKLVIADGHHRYETALAYRNEQRAARKKIDLDAPHEKVMMTLVNSHSDGLTILPTHRVVTDLTRFDPAALRQQLSEHFEIRDVSLPADPARRAATARDQLSKADSSGRAIGLFAGGDRLNLLVLKPGADLVTAMRDSTPSQRELDVVLLHSLILGKGLGITAEAVRDEQNIRYERDAVAAMDAVSAGRAQACFLLNPVRVEQVMSMALAGEVLPQKSTDFYPKMLSGITIYRLE